jgi:hypothetical protein
MWVFNFELSYGFPTCVLDLAQAKILLILCVVEKFTFFALTLACIRTSKSIN